MMDTSQQVNKDKGKLTNNLTSNKNIFIENFVYQINRDFIIRDINILCIKKDAVLLYLDPLTDKEKIDNNVIAPLMFNKDRSDLENFDVSTLTKKVITVEAGGNTDDVFKLISEILDGNSVLIVEGFTEAIILHTSKFEYREVEKPINENTTKGPQEAFTEFGGVNRSLIRKTLKEPKLISEIIYFGKGKENIITLMYIKDLAEEQLITEVKNRINAIGEKSVLRIPTVEQLIEDSPYSLLPSTFSTERPDRACYFLQEGRVAIFMESSSNCLIVPVTFWTLFHSADDMYQRWVYGNFLRIVREIAIIIAALLPASYIAITMYHIDMIPIDLVIAIAASRENLPFPAIVEIVLMELSFELIREAGVRIPTTIGPTIGIVGALILGQAAVEANIISPILVIIVALSGLGSFAIPEQSLGFFIRISRFIFLVAAAIGGFFGVALVGTAVLAYMSVYESFGVPFLSPKAPSYTSSKDFFTRIPITVKNNKKK